MSGHLVFGWFGCSIERTHSDRYCECVNSFFNLFFRFHLHRGRARYVPLFRITIPSRECEFPPLKNKNLLVDFLYIVPTIFDWECEELTINILTDIVFDFDFVVGDCCNHAKNSNSDWKRCKEKNEFIFRLCNRIWMRVLQLVLQWVGEEPLQGCGGNPKRNGVCEVS